MKKKSMRPKNIKMDATTRRLLARLAKTYDGNESCTIRVLIREAATRMGLS